MYLFNNCIGEGAVAPADDAAGAAFLSTEL